MIAAVLFNWIMGKSVLFIQVCSFNVILVLFCSFIVLFRKLLTNLKM